MIEDAVNGDYAYIERDALDEFAQSDPPYTAHIASCIQRELLSTTHDACDWPFVQHRHGGWWYRSGKCPACGQR